MEESNFKAIEIKDFIKQLIEQIEEAVDIEKRSIISDIDIELKIEKVISKEGKLQMYVAPGKFDGETTSSIARASFKVRPRQSNREALVVEQVVRQNEENAKKWSNPF